MGRIPHRRRGCQHWLAAASLPSLATTPSRVRARLSLPASLPTLARRLGGCALALALGVAVTAAPAAAQKRKGSSRRSAERTAAPALDLPTLPELPQVDLGTLGALTTDIDDIEVDVLVLEGRLRVA